MKQRYSIQVGNVVSPVNDREVALFSMAMSAPVTLTLLEKLGIAVPPEVQMEHHTGADDPPDISALGLGWECTEFPPDQSALDAVHKEQGAMIVPGFSQTGGNIAKIRALAKPFNAYPEPFSVTDEISSLKRIFLEKVIGGPRSKDVPGNDVLLLDQRASGWPADAEMALRQALTEKKPINIRAVLLVRWQRGDVDHSKPPVPVVVQLFPPQP